MAVVKARRGGFGGLPQKKLKILGSGKCILVDSGDGFAMDNRGSKKTLRSDREVRTPPTLPLYPPLYVLVKVRYIALEIK